MEAAAHSIIARQKKQPKVVTRAEVDGAGNGSNQYCNEYRGTFTERNYAVADMIGKALMEVIPAQRNGKLAEALCQQPNTCAITIKKHRQNKI